jgi:hypothetical protein
MDAIPSRTAGRAKSQLGEIRRRESLTRLHLDSATVS